MIERALIRASFAFCNEICIISPEFFNYVDYEYLLRNRMVRNVA